MLESSPMETNQIDETEFIRLVMDVIGQSRGNDVLWGIRKALEYRLDLDRQEYFLDLPNDIEQFEGFIKETIDKYGLNLTGDKAIIIARNIIRNSQKTTVYKKNS
jgi:hypothetical protein